MEQDLAVSFYTTVGNIAIARGGAVLIANNACKGILYVKDDSLYYETKCCGKLCCRCCRQSFKLSEIQNVEVLQNQAVPYDGRNRIHLSLGLRITAGSYLIVAAAPDASSFAEQLLHACNLSTDKDGF